MVYPRVALVVILHDKTTPPRLATLRGLLVGPVPVPVASPGGDSSGDAGRLSGARVMQVGKGYTTTQSDTISYQQVLHGDEPHQQGRQQLIFRLLISMFHALSMN